MSGISLAVAPPTARCVAAARMEEYFFRAAQSVDEGLTQLAASPCGGSLLAAQKFQR